MDNRPSAASKGHKMAPVSSRGCQRCQPKRVRSAMCKPRQPCPQANINSSDCSTSRSGSIRPCTMRAYGVAAPKASYAHRVPTKCPASSSGRHSPSANRRPSIHGMRRLRRRHSATPASARWVSTAPYSSTVPGSECHTVLSQPISALAAPSDTKPMAWLPRCRAT